MKKKKNYTLYKSVLKNILKISDPFLMIDKVTNITPFKEGIGVKNIKKNEWFYKCHFFNDEPMMPGTLQIEAMLQTTIAVLFLKNKQIEKYLITKCESNFFSKIRSAGTMMVIIQIIKEKNGIIESKAEIFFNKKKISNGIYKFINPKIFKLDVK
jgi:3-hydroxymyristoyl/3-hydroxydecanoyl-(acyl carrier protein) dehydratase